MQQIVRTIRNLRAFAQVPPLRTLPAVRLASRNAEERAAIEATRQAIAYLGRVEQLPSKRWPTSTSSRWRWAWPVPYR